MWTGLWPDRPTHEVPIGHITNGVHIPTWMGAEYRSLFDRHLGSDWMSRRALPETWANVDQISDAGSRRPKPLKRLGWLKSWAVTWILTPCLLGLRDVLPLINGRPC